MVKLALAQINCWVGALEYNTQKILDQIKLAKKYKVDLVIFPELAITGYPPEDLLLKPQFIKDNLKALKKIVNASKDIVIIVGFVDEKDDKLFNAAALINNKKIIGIYYKKMLPNYGVFDEIRYFSPGEESPVFKIKGLKIGISICEDVWKDSGPVSDEVKKGAELIININASPFHVGKIKERESVLKQRAIENKVPMVYVNLIGGQDELVFDGGSMVLDPGGQIIARASQFKEELLIVDFKESNKLEKIQTTEEEIYNALLLGVKDYVSKNGFNDIVIGLSGGIDSALTLAIAVDALGADHVKTVFMPSAYTSRQSMNDARDLAKNLKVELLEIPIQPVFSAFKVMVSKAFKGHAHDITEENLQARIRGNILMALSNKFGWLVLTTGNKSEMSVGYCTMYGDMAGGFAVIKDVQKTMVYKLSKYRNKLSHIIPESVITKAPTAELKPRQKDQDTLPPYDILDEIMADYVEENKGFNKI
ncbi:MAG: NAD+ synthase, partial [Elusimicrobia bacterium]|nr:NAD+ synthase [Elusimicrobiota bacterium]